MSWIYHRLTGELYRNAERVAKRSYTGRITGQPIPALQRLARRGPLPPGSYSIGAPFHHPEAGGYSLRLTPCPTNYRSERTGALIHGANIQHPPHWSDGCIVLPMIIRAKIWNSGDHLLQVVP